MARARGRRGRRAAHLHTRPLHLSQVVARRHAYPGGAGLGPDVSGVDPEGEPGGAHGSGLGPRRWGGRHARRAVLRPQRCSPDRRSRPDLRHHFRGARVDAVGRDGPEGDHPGPGSSLLRREPGPARERDLPLAGRLPGSGAGRLRPVRGHGASGRRRCTRGERRGPGARELPGPEAHGHRRPVSRLGPGRRDRALVDRERPRRLRPRPGPGVRRQRRHGGGRPGGGRGPGRGGRRGRRVSTGRVPDRDRGGA